MVHTLYVDILLRSFNSKPVAGRGIALQVGNGAQMQRQEVQLLQRSRTRMTRPRYPDGERRTGVRPISGGNNSNQRKRQAKAGPPRHEERGYGNSLW